MPIRYLPTMIATHATNLVAVAAWLRSQSALLARLEGQSSSFRWSLPPQSSKRSSWGSSDRMINQVDIEFRDDLHRLIAVTRRGGCFDYPDDYYDKSPLYSPLGLLRIRLVDNPRFRDSLFFTEKIRVGAWPAIFLMLRIFTGFCEESDGFLTASSGTGSLTQPRITSSVEVPRGQLSDTRSFRDPCPGLPPLWFFVRRS